MKPIPKKLLKEILADPYYKQCCRKNDGECSGRITFEHSWIYAGSQINEKFAIIPLCWRHHLGAGLVKEKNQIIALNRATKEDLKKYPNKNWAKERQRLEYILNH